MRKLSILIPLLCLLPWQLSAQVVQADSLGSVTRSATSPADFLTGRVSGVRIGAVDNGSLSPAVTHIRGLNSMRGSSEPLWIVDGVALNSTLENNLDAFWQYPGEVYTSPVNDRSFLSPDWIESIEVIKNTSAAAMYGPAAANGVIVVKTRLPKDDGRIIRLNSSAGNGGHNHSVFLSENRNRTAYGISAFYRDRFGEYKGLGTSEGGLKLNLDSRANSVVRFGMNALAYMGTGLSASGVAIPGKSSWTLAQRKALPAEAIDSVEGWEKSYEDRSESFRGLNYVYLTLNPFRNFSWKTDAGVDYEHQNRYIWFDEGTSFGKENEGAASILSTTLFSYNASSVVTYERFLGKDFGFVMKAGVDARGGIYKYGTMNSTGFFSYELHAKGLHFGSSKDYPHKFGEEAAQLGAFASLSCDWKHILSLDGTVRYDTTPKYDEGAYRIHPYANLNLDLHRAFFPASKAVSALTLHAGWGQAGRENYLPTQLYSYFTGSPAPQIESDVAVYYDILSRLESSEFNAGVSLALLSGKIKLEVEWYDKHTDDALTLYYKGEPSSTPGLLQYGKRTVFSELCGEVGNRGLEASAEVQLLKNRNNSLSLSLNVSRNAGQILRVDESEIFSRRIGGVLTSVEAYGRPVSAFYGFRTGDDGRPVDMTCDGKISEADKVVLGNPTPKWLASMGVHFCSGRFTADAVVTSAAGFDILNLNSMFLEQTLTVTDAYVQNGDYLRLSDISLGYSFPVKGKTLKGISVKGGARNLLTLTGYRGSSPDVSCFASSNLLAGIDYGSFTLKPLAVLGVQFDF